MNNKFTLSFIFCIGFFLNAQSQIKWSGAGDGTTWQSTTNWDGGKVPSATDIVEIGINATITGTSAVCKQIKVISKANVNLDLDMKIGDLTSDQHAITLGSACKLTFGNDNSAKTFDLVTSDTKNGIANFASSDSAFLEIKKLAVLNFSGASIGINVVAPNTQVKNFGKLNFSSTVKTGIKSACIFTNHGNITSSGVITDGISISGKIFTNEESGIISCSNSGDDGIEVIDRGKLVNKGIINTLLKDAAGFSNVGIAVGTKDSLGYFENDKSGILNLDGGPSTNGRGVAVLEKGSFINHGQVNPTKGAAGSRLFSRNMMHNANGGIMNMGDGKIQIAVGTFTNDGYITSKFTGPGVSCDTLTTVLNNGFYRYLNGNQFSSGKGTITNNGINAKDTSKTNIDAKGTCKVKLGATSYPWFEGNTSIGSSDDNGVLTFAPKTLTGNPVVINTIFDSLTITVKNYCPEANVTGIDDGIYIWDGGGDGTSWNDAKNWDTDELPKEGTLIEFKSDATVSGNSLIKPANIKLSQGAKVAFNLDLNVGDGTIDQHGITIGNKCNLTLGDGKSFVIKTSKTKQGIAAFGSSKGARLEVGKNSNLTIFNASTGINIANDSSFVINNGTIKIDSTVKVGIKSASSFENAVGGIISADHNQGDALNISKKPFTNHGTINVNASADEGIEILETSFINEGTVNIIVKEDATFGNNGILIDSLSQFDNHQNGKVNINGGTSANARSIVVDADATLINHGNIQIENGSNSGSILSNGKSSNEKGALIALPNGRVNVAAGTFTNKGYIKSGYTSAGVFADTLTDVTNFGFYAYANGSVFANGKGMVIDTGLNVNRFINAKKLCDIDLAEVAYEWQTVDGKSLGSSSETGKLTFAPKSLTTDSIIIKTVYDFELKVRNICPEAILSSVNYEAFNASVWIYPTLINCGGEVRLVSTTASLDNTNMTITDIMGCTINSIPISTENNVILAPTQPGTYFITVSQNQKITTKKLVVIH